MAPPPRHDDFDPTTGDFNSGRLPEAGAPSPPPRRPTSPSESSRTRSSTTTASSYRPSTPYPSYSSPAPRTSTSSDSDGGLGLVALLAAVIAAVFLMGQPRGPATPSLVPDRTTPSPQTTSGSPDRTIEVLPPDGTPSTGLSRDGDRITVSIHEVVLDAPWVIDRPTFISGRGPDVSVITYTGPGSLLTFVGDGTLRIEGVTLARRSTNPGNVVTVDSGTLELANARLQGGVAGPGYSGAGLVLDGTANARIERATVERNAVGVRLLEAASVHMLGTEVRDNQAIGIVLAGQADGVVRESLIAGNGAEGIAVGDDSRASIAGNRIVGNAARGVSFLGRATGSATGNEIAGNGYGDAQRTDYWQGMAVQDAAHVTLHGNTVRDNAGVGIQFLHAAGGSVRDNTVTGNSANHAAYLLASGRPAVSAGGLVLGMLGQRQDPRPDVQPNRIERNTGGDLVVDYRPTADSATTPTTPAPGRVTPTQTPAPVYLLASTADGRGALHTDGHLNVYVANVPIHRDTRPRNGPAIAPISLQVERGDSLWIEVVNTHGDGCRWSDVYLVDPTGRGHLVLAGSVVVSGCRRGVVALVEFVVP
jgi:parallel beta-helix repeat protein